MPRHYKRKTNRKSYTCDLLNEALTKIRSGTLSIRRCSLEYSIPKSTLRDHIKGRRGQLGSNKGGCGRGTALPPDKELELVRCLKSMSQWGFGLSRSEILDVVQKFVNKSGLKTPFKNNRPGQDWWLGFKARHRLSLKKPELLEHSRRKQASDPFIIYGFYDLLEKVINDCKLQDKPTLIYNCDETSFSHDPSKTKIVNAIGQPCHRVTAGTGRDNTSVLACVNAAGEKLPPLIIFKSKNLWDQWFPRKEDEYPNTSYVAAPKGWMNAEIFENWFRGTFIQSISEERPVLLIFDGHTSHVSPEVILCALENQIIILKLPPHTSHILQPLDVCCFRGLKAKWDQLLCAWQRDTGAIRSTKKTFATLLGKAWVSMGAENIKSGFRSTGIFDEAFNGVNRGAIKETSFDPEKLKKHNEFVKEQITIPQHDNANPTPSTSQTYEGETDNGDREPLITTSVQEDHEKENVPHNITFDNLLGLQMIPVNRANQKDTTEGKKRKIANTAEILTNVNKEQVLLRIEEKQQAVKKQLKKEKPKKITNSKVLHQEHNSESDTASEFSIHDTSSDNLSEAESFNIPKEDINVSDFCLISFPTKKNVKYYIGQVAEKLPQNEFFVKFLRCKCKSKKLFNWPDVADESVIHQDDIEKKLPAPIEVGRGILQFEVNFVKYNCF